MIPIENSNEAVITGVGVVNAISNNFNEFICSMIQGKCGQGPITSFSTEGLRNKHACESIHFDSALVYKKWERDNRKMERSSELVLSAYYEALSMSELDTQTVNPERGAVALGSTLGGSVTGNRYYRGVKSKKRRPNLLRDYSLHAPGHRICIDSNFLGPNLVFSSACTSSNQALATALDLIRYNKADVVITGGFDTMSEVTCAGFSVMRNISPDICRPFDINRRGLVLGEGSAILVVESSEFARKRKAKVLGSLKGYGVASDAFHMTAPDLTAVGPASAMKKAVEMACTEAEIDLICTHGTGTVHNDRIEAKAIYKVFGEQAADIPCTSIKSMIGHTLGAAGAMNALAAIAANQKKFIPPTIHYKTPEKLYPLSCSAIARDANPQLILSNTFGFGGANCSVVIKLNS